MRCINCQAELADTDRFCPQCGAPVMSSQIMYEEDPVHHMISERDILYDEHLFRDSFLEDKRENRSHALLITLGILLVIALGAGIFLFFYFHLEKKIFAGGAENQDVITIVSDTSQADDNSSLVQEEMIIILDPKEQDIPQSTATMTEQTVLSEAALPEDDESIIHAAIEKIMTEHADTQAYAVYVYDLKNQKEYTAGAFADRMYASGTITVPILYAAASLLDQGRITLNDQITYVNSIGGRGEASPESREGKTYPLSYYLTTMLSYNDNNCMNCMIDTLGLDTINELCSNSGMTGCELERALVTEVTDGKENYVSARDLTMMVKELYNGKFSVIGREFMNSYFRIDEYDANRTLIGMSDDVLQGAKLFLNQNGKGDTRFAETALIGDETCSYIISVLCRGEYGFLYEDAVKEVSSYVWNALHRNESGN